MSCRACGFEVAPDFAFCPKCGAKQDRSCPSCGYEVAADFAFCPKCGGALADTGTIAAARPAAEGEGRARATVAEVPVRPSPTRRAVTREADRRPVTVLFADLSGFTALSERLDPEDVRALQTDLHREFADVIRLYDGFLEKFVGDAALAIFGAPVAHEDDPERALRSALDMRTRVAALDERWQGRIAGGLSLHIGVNTGPVVAGDLGSGDASAYAVTGDTVNTAARLLSAAGDNEILVGPTTHQLMQHRFAFEPVGALAVKGKSEPVTAFRLVGEAAVVNMPRGLASYGLAAPMVGRERDIDQLAACFEQALTGRAQVVRIVGDAGAGKTRLVEEFLLRLAQSRRLDGVAVRRSACSALADQTYGVLASLVREGYGIAPGDDIEVARAKLVSGFHSIGVGDDDARQMARFMGHVLGLYARDDADLANLEPEQFKRQVFMAARTMFERRLASGPVVLVVDDLHWADSASIELLRFLVDRLDDRKLLLLLTHRPGFDVSTLATSRTSQVARRLAPLSAKDCESVLAGMFGESVSRIPAGVRRFVIERGSGNPFYLEEIVRSLIDGGMLVRKDDGWHCVQSVTAQDLPLTIQGMLLSRLDRLADEVRQVTHEAAVLGTEFDAALLSAMSGLPDAVEGSLEALQDAELIEQVTRGRPGAEAGLAADRHYRFSHAIVQEVVYQNLLVRRRGELHGEAGRALEKLCAGRVERLEDIEALARHFSRSAEKVKGVRYLVRAGDWARRIFANDDAAKHYQLALQTIDECRGCEQERPGLVERLGDVLSTLGRRDQALGHYETVLAAAAAAGDAVGEARLQRKIAAQHWEAGARGVALERIKAALALLQDQGQDHVELAHLYQEMGRLAFRSGDNAGAIDWAGRALQQAERLLARATGNGADRGAAMEAAAVVAEAYNTLGVARARMGDPQQAVADVERSLEVAERHGLHTVACRGYTNLSVLYSTLDPGKAIETCQRGLAVAKKIGDLGFQSRLYANLGVSYCTFTGRCEGEGVDAVRRAIDLDRQLGLVDHLPVSLVVLGQIYQCHGQPLVAVDLYKEALDLAEDLDEPQILFPCYDGLATVHLDLDDIEAAEGYMEKAQAVCERAGLDPESLVVLPFLC